MLLDSFTCFSLSGPWVAVKGRNEMCSPCVHMLCVHHSFVCIPWANAWDCSLAPGWTKVGLTVLAGGGQL